MQKKLLTEIDVDNRLEGRNLQRLGKYSGSSTKIAFKCLIDGYEWLARPSDIFSGMNCPKCSNRIPLTNELFD